MKANCPDRGEATDRLLIGVAIAVATFNAALYPLVRATDLVPGRIALYCAIPSALILIVLLARIAFSPAHLQAVWTAAAEMGGSIGKIRPIWPSDPKWGFFGSEFGGLCYATILRLILFIEWGFEIFFADEASATVLCGLGLGVAVTVTLMALSGRRPKEPVPYFSSSGTP